MNTVLLDPVKPNNIVVQKIALDLLREMAAAHEFRSGRRANDRREYLHAGMLFRIRKIPCQRKPEIVVSVGGVRNKILPPTIEFVPPGIGEPVTHIAFQAMTPGLVPEHPGILHAHGPIGRFHLRMMKGALLKIERPARAPYETVDGVVAVLRAETVQ